MKRVIPFAAFAAALAVSGCVSAPSGQADLAAWEAEKSARTEARRKAPGSVLPGSARATEDGSQAFEDYRDTFQRPTEECQYSC